MSGDMLQPRRGAFFQEIDVLDGQVEAVRTREDRAAELATLLDWAFQSFVGIAPAEFEASALKPLMLLS